MVPLERFEAVQHSAVEPGDILIAEGDGPGLSLVVEIDGKRFAVDLAAVNDGGFSLRRFNDIGGTRVRLRQSSITISHELKLSPTKVDIPRGCLALGEHGAGFVANVFGGTGLAMSAGGVFPQLTYSGTVFFPRWGIAVPGIDGHPISLYSHDCSA
ncbi:MAG TPA: hypothetical protein VF503_09175 [Sphingobium sp.]|uniref:hypothetical protein n=1 Tax=Sphingobium sp. TaxID=1912891 RepID=UPI002ED386CE